MQTIYILSNYSNYHNRQVKKEATLQAYRDKANVVHIQTDVNFVANDGINTVHTFGSNVNSYNGDGDYLLVVDSSTNAIITRWFIIDSIRDRAGQYTLTLRRDLLVDYYDDIMNSDCFIEKANFASNDINNPLLFTKEDFSVNQIKTNEYKLMDKTKCAWIVGYYSKGVNRLQGTIPQPDTENSGYISLLTPIRNWKFYQYSNLAGEGQQWVYGFPTAGTYTVRALAAGKNYSVDFKFNMFDYNREQINVTTQDTGVTSQVGYQFTGDRDEAADALGVAMAQNLTTTKMVEYVQPLLGSQFMTTEEYYNNFLNFEGKTIKDSEGAYYKVHIIELTTDDTIERKGQAVFATEIKNAMTASGRFSVYNSNYTSSSITLNMTCKTYQVELTQLNNLSLTYDIQPLVQTVDAPYNMFAIPVDGKVRTGAATNPATTTSKDIAIRTAMAIQAQHGSNIYDIQLLPYCPVQDLVNSSGIVVCSDSKQYSEIKTGDNTIYGTILNISRANFTFDLPITGLGIKSSGTTAIEKKINNECDKWRMCSPNYSNYFDFSVEKNNGIPYFNVDCSYKPYSPYIHINPNFQHLYGYDDNSPRGLVLGGDFSLSQISDKWIEYQIQNKNFQLTFDRQIQNLEVQQEIGRIQDKWSIGGGTISGAASGALTGSMVGGGYGAIAGAVIGAGASLVGGITDYRLNEKLRAEALDYTKDMFGYQLGNIQALPLTLSKITAYTLNNKIFPILEYYTCKSVEKKALLEKIAWNGMSVYIIGKPSTYVSNKWTYDNIESKGYLKAKLIRLPNAGESYRIINEISGELDKGAYYK